MMGLFLIPVCMVCCELLFLQMCIVLTTKCKSNAFRHSLISWSLRFSIKNSCVVYFQLSEQFQIESKLQSARCAENCRHRSPSKVNIDERRVKSWLSSPNCSFKRHFKQAAQIQVSISIMLDSWLSAVIILKSFQIPANHLFAGALHAQLVPSTNLYTE